MRVDAGGVASVKGLKCTKAMLGSSPLEAAVALMAGHLDDLQLAIERVYLGCNVEDPCV